MKEKLFETTLGSELVFKGKILALYYDKVKIANGVTATREVVRHPGAVAIVPVTPQGEVIMVRQFRYPIKKVLMEIPAGKLDQGETSLDCARRELLEEAGLTGSKFSRLTSIYTSPGFLDEKIDIFLATGFREVHNNPDHDELLSVVKVSLVKCLEMIRTGKIRDAKSIIGLQLAFDQLEFIKS